MLRTPRSFALLFGAILFMGLGFGNAFVPLVSVSEVSMAGLYAKLATTSFSIALVTVIFLMLTLPYDFALIASSSRKRKFAILYAMTILAIVVITLIAAGATVATPTGSWFDTNTRLWWVLVAGIVLPVAVGIDLVAYRTSPPAKSVTTAVAGALIIFLIFDIVYQMAGGKSEDWIWMDMGLIAPPAVISMLLMTNRLQDVVPVAEPLSKGSKSQYNLLEGRIYVVEEKRPHFSFTLFSEILRSRCHDCVNDESFSCESLDCSKCLLPCPCKECELYVNRTQGLVVTRRHPSDFRLDYLIQTTPVIWLTSIPGKDNMDPAKLSMLTDMIVNFLEHSDNGVVLVEGVEYLVTANDFPRMLRALDRWSEVVMARSARLVMSLDPRAFDPKELALVERNREVINPKDQASVEKILAVAAATA